jgi:type II secretory pathway component PulF
MQFQYVAKSLSGDRTEGVLEAATAADARRSLRAQNLFPLTIAPGRGGTVADAGVNPKAVALPRAMTSAGLGERLRFRSGKVPRVELLTATSQLAIMTRSGVDLADALWNVADQCRHPALRKVLRDVHEDVSDGQPVSVAMGRHESVFGSAYVAGIAAGEASGTMTDVLARLTELLRNEIRLRGTLRSILAYPVVLTAVAAAVLMTLVLVVLPQFSKVFKDLGATPPPLTRILLDSGDWIRAHLAVMGIGAAVAAVAAGKLWATDAARMWRDRVLLATPVVSRASQPLLTGRLFRLLGAMLQTGVPLLEALRLGRNSIANRRFRDLLVDLEDEVINGRGIGATLAGIDFIPPGAAQMIRTAEHSGHLGDVMLMAGEFYEEEGERQVRTLVKLLEPAVIVVMGVVVAGIVLAVMLPLLDVSTMSGVE